MNSVLLDTSFLICLSSPGREHHAVAKMYFQRFIAENVTMHLSTIVISEFEVKQRITDLGLSNFIVLPFNFEDVRATARLFLSMHEGRQKNDARDAVKDDAKLIGQCVSNGISHFITDDAHCARRISGTREQGLIAEVPHPISLHQPFWPGWFSKDNQGDLLADFI